MGDIGLTFLGILLFLSSLFMMLLILVQRGKGGGLTGALGGMGGQSAFGSKAGDVFTRITIVTAIIWITLCMITIAAYNPPPKNNLTKKPMPSLESTDEDEEAGMGGMGSGEQAETDEGEGSENLDLSGDTDQELSDLLPGVEGEGSEDSKASDDPETSSDSNDVDSDSGPSLDDPEDSDSPTQENDDEN